MERRGLDAPRYNTIRREVYFDKDGIRYQGIYDYSQWVESAESVMDRLFKDVNVIVSDESRDK